MNTSDRLQGSVRPEWEPSVITNSSSLPPLPLLSCQLLVSPVISIALGFWGIWQCQPAQGECLLNAIQMNEVRSSKALEKKLLRSKVGWNYTL